MCVIFIAWPGKMARNSHSIARHFNVAMKSIRRAVRPKSQSLWVYVLCVPCFVFAEEAPSLELLEFLGDWEISENEWQDPLDFMQDLDALDAETQTAKVEEAQDAQ